MNIRTITVTVSGGLLALGISAGSGATEPQAASPPSPVGAAESLAAPARGAAAAAAHRVSVARIVPAQPSGAAPDQIGVVLFFDFSPTSLALLRRMQAWGGESGEQIVLDREPLAAGGSDALVRAFVVARTLGVADEVLPGLFRLAAHRPPPAQLQQALADVFKRWGIEPIAFDAAWNSALATAGVTRALALAARYQVSRAPVIVVNGVWRIAAPPGAAMPSVIAALNTEVAAVSTSEAENQ